MGGPLIFEVKDGQRPHGRLKAPFFVLALLGGIAFLVTGSTWTGIVLVVLAVVALATMARGLNPWWLRSWADPPQPGAGAKVEPPKREDPPRFDPPHRQVP